MDRARLDAVETYLAVSDSERRWDADERGKAHAAVRLTGVRRRATVVDLGSGQGWHARQLARDFQVVAVEREPRLAAEAAGRARRRVGSAPAVVIASTSDVPIRDAVADMAMSIGSSLGFGTTGDDRGMLDEIRRLLRPGARAVIEAVSADGAECLESRRRQYPDGVAAAYGPLFDAATQTLRERQHVVLPGGRHGALGYRLHAYDPGELLQLARDAGLAEDGVYGSLQGARWAAPDPIVLVLRRPEPVCQVRLDTGEIVSGGPAP